MVALAQPPLTSPARTGPGSAHRGDRWIRGPAADQAVAWAWVPFFAAGAFFPHQVPLILVMAFAASFAHQPLTLLLVYGDPGRFGLRRRLFLVSPMVFVVAVTIGMWVSAILVAVVAGLWNAHHTLMQRYGLTRIYARKAEEDGDGGPERAMLVSWLVGTLLWVAADPRTPGYLRSVNIGDVNAEAVRLLADLRPAAAILLWPMLAAVAVVTLRWVFVERDRDEAATRPKRLYLLATAGLFVAIAIHPVWGLAGFVGAHALEYFAVVEHATARERRAGTAAGLMGHGLRSLGAKGVLVSYLAAAAVLYAVLHSGSQTALTWFVLVVGGMHVFYDGFIWKLRRPEVARSLGVEGVPPAVTATA